MDLFKKKNSLIIVFALLFIYMEVFNFIFCQMSIINMEIYCITFLCLIFSMDIDCCLLTPTKLIYLLDTFPSAYDKFEYIFFGVEVVKIFIEAFFFKKKRKKKMKNDWSIIFAMKSQTRRRPTILPCPGLVNRRE